MSFTTRNLKRAYSCNTELLVFRRQRKGWTQAELARAAGYSERLVSKAESGRSISRQAIADIAEALSFTDNPLHAEDLICDPLTLARQFVEQFFHQNAAADISYSSFLDKDVSLHVSGNEESGLFSGTHHGIRQTAKILQALSSVFGMNPETEKGTDPRFFAQGNNVMVWGNTLIRSEGAGLADPLALCLLLSLRQGKLRSIDCRFCGLVPCKPN